MEFGRRRFELFRKLIERPVHALHHPNDIHTLPANDSRWLPDILRIYDWSLPSHQKFRPVEGQILKNVRLPCNIRSRFQKGRSSESDGEKIRPLKNFDSARENSLE
jgi:hypothetical protein